MSKKPTKKQQQQLQEFYDDVVKDVTSDFEIRKQARRSYELTWRQNLNFLMGNQYCNVAPNGDVVQEDKCFFWQEKQVFNHIVPIVETRISRLCRNKPKPMVRPYTSSQEDVNSAQLSDKILATLHDRLDMDDVVNQAVTWSETCGTSFYKVSWVSNAGEVVDPNRQDVALTVCPPFEIFPDSNVCQSMQDVQSLIHARVFSVQEIKRIWGKDVEGSTQQTMSFDGVVGAGGLGYNATVPRVAFDKVEDGCVVIERYTRPNASYPNGKLEIVAGNTLLYFGELPYQVGNNGQRDLPFVRQVSFLQPGCFWGASVIERLIPVQRAYNALKNRKHEFLNRLTMGILMVEDGSVDTDNLQEEGLSPGKILVYRQGANLPQIMDNGTLPIDFDKEELRLLDEFVSISGVSDFARNSTTPANVTSGTAMQLISEQDEMRMSCSVEELHAALKKIAKLCLQLYKQFAGHNKLMRIVQGNKADLMYLSSADISNGDIVFDTEGEISGSIASRRAVIFQLLGSGLLTDQDGNVSTQHKERLLNLLGLGSWKDEKPLATLH
ncbi:MAG: hypothetical protein IKC47_02265, partial [Clostridia bacterium]|nr:hypothetical protein [Clostridia bacterium]